MNWRYSGKIINRENKKGLVYGTTDKQKKEFQDGLYQIIFGVWET